MWYKLQFLLPFIVLASGYLLFNSLISYEKLDPAHSLAKGASHAQAVLEPQRKTTLRPQERQLANGIKVVLLPTTFESDEITLRVIIPKGYGDVPEGHRAAAQLAMDIIWEQGLLGRDSDALSAWLYGAGIEAFTKIDPHLSRLEACAISEAMPDVIALAQAFLQQNSFTNKSVRR